MAIVKAPLLSLTARGRLDKALIFQKRKRQDVVKAYAVPTYPGSADQELYRNKFQIRADFWSTRMIGSQIREAWQRYARLAPGLGHAYTYAMTGMHESQLIENQPLFCEQCLWGPSEFLSFSWSTIETHVGYTGGKEFVYKVGDAPDQLEIVDTFVATGTFHFYSLNLPGGTVKYAAMAYKDNLSVNVGGICRVVRVAP